MIYHTFSPKETQELAENLVKKFKNKIVCLDGEMGVGKTAFVQGCVRFLGYSDCVTSPTFAICNEYQTKNTKILHYDLYRIADKDELFSIGFYDDFADYVFVEWAGDMLDGLDNIIRIKFSYGEEENERIIEI